MIGSHDVRLAGELFRQLYLKYSLIENKKYLYRTITDLTLIEINTLLVIGVAGRKTMSSIAKELGVSFGTPTVTMDRLEAKGYVERIRDREDRRQVWIALSHKGQEVYVTLVQLRDRITEKIFGILTTEERAALISSMAKINSHLDSVVGHMDEAMAVEAKNTK